jgi:hypothetical protein
VAVAEPATVTDSPRSSSVSSTRSSRLDQRRRERISRAERNASAYASKYAHSRVIEASADVQRSLVTPVSSAPSRSLRPAWSCRARSEVSIASCSAPSRASARSTSSRSITGPGGPVTPIDHLSLLKGCCVVVNCVWSAVRQLLRRYCGAGGSDFVESLSSVADSHLLYDACQPSVVSSR